MVKTPSYIYLLIICTSFRVIHSSKIVLLNSKPNDYLIKHQPNKQILLLPNNSNDINDSVKICKLILGTFHALGKQSMKQYEQCEGNYELLGMKDGKMQSDNPNCYTNLSKLFCNQYITPCEDTSYDIDLIRFVLSLINQCINFTPDGQLKSQYHCSSLNEAKYIIEDPKKFCLKAEKKVVLIDSESKETYEYLRVKEPKQSQCLNIVDSYNFCINSENILNLNYNYTRCFQSTNSIYIGNKIGKFNDKEKDFCQNYILSAFASINLHSTIEISNENVCENFDQKILKQHDAYSNGVGRRIENTNRVIKEKETIIEFVLKMNKSTQELLNMISKIINNWKEIKEYINDRIEKISINELKALELLNSNVDLLYEASINIKKILDQKDINDDELTKVLPNYHSLLINCKLLFKDSDNKSKLLIKALKHVNSNNQQEFRQSKHETNKTILQMNSKLMQIIINIKAFLKYLREQLVNNRKYHENEIKGLEKEKKNKISYKNRIINQKNNYRSFALTPSL